MFRTLRCSLLLFVLGAPAASVYAQVVDSAAPVPPIAARSWLLMDYQTARPIAASNADERIEPASLTKLMSAYVVFAALKEQQFSLAHLLPVSTKAWKMPGSRMFIEPNTAVAIAELLRGMIVQSGNDATIALAEGVAGSEETFVHRMNEQAARLGLTNTRFVNATGLTNPQHYSTAADLARLASAVIRDFPEQFALYSLRDYTYNQITQRNRNDLLFRDPFVDGLKTGYTESAGYCIVATARREDRRLLAVVTGAASEGARAIEAQKLLNYGFQHYETLKLYPKGQPVARLPVWKGSEPQLNAGFLDDLYVAIPKGQREMLKARLESLQPLIAPIGLQQPVGVLRLTLGDQPYGEFPVLALEPVSVANVFVRAWHSLRLLFK